MPSLTDLLRWLPDVAPRNAHSLAHEDDRLSKEREPLQSRHTRRP